MTNFTQVPNRAWKTQREEIRLYAALLHYQSLTRHNNKGDATFVGQDTLAQDLGVSESTIKRWTTRLERGGWITVTRRGKRQTNLYRVHQEPVDVILESLGDSSDVNPHHDDADSDGADLHSHHGGERSDMTPTMVQGCTPSNTDSSNTELKNSNTDGGAVAPHKGNLLETTKEHAFVESIETSLDMSWEAAENRREGDTPNPYLEGLLKSLPKEHRQDAFDYCSTLIDRGLKAQSALMQYRKVVLREP